MNIKCPVMIPEPKTAKTPKEKIGLLNAIKFSTHAEEGLATASLPLHLGRLNRKIIAEKLKFGRSAYEQNTYIGKIAAWIDEMLEKKPRSSVPGNAQAENEREVTRLNNRIIELKISLDDANARLYTLSFIEKTVDSGQVRLPW